MNRFRLSAAADADMRKIAEHTAEQWGAEPRDAYITELFEAFARLAVTPEIAARIDIFERAIEGSPEVVMSSSLENRRHMASKSFACCTNGWTLKRILVLINAKRTGGVAVRLRYLLESRPSMYCSNASQRQKSSFGKYCSSASSLGLPSSCQNVPSSFCSSRVYPS